MFFIEYFLYLYIYHLIHIIKHYDLIINCLTGHNYSVLRPLDILNVKTITINIKYCKSIVGIYN